MGAPGLQRDETFDPQVGEFKYELICYSRERREHSKIEVG